MGKSRKNLKIGIVAPAAKVPKFELDLAADKLRGAGFEVMIHPQCRKSDLFFSGSDIERAQAIYEFARDPSVSVVWYARGGYGTVRLLPILDRLAREKGIPEQKLLVGYSDATILLDYVRQRWGWSALHAPMPAAISFLNLKSKEWNGLLSLVNSERFLNPWGASKLKFYVKPPSQPIMAEMAGGNLTLLASVVGTPYQIQAGGKILFMEDVDERLFRLDRMLQQMYLSGSLNGVKAIVLGNFMNCSDSAPLVLKRQIRFPSQPKPKDLAPLRKPISAASGIKRIFSDLGNTLNIPVAYGLQVGHGPGHGSLPLGGRYRLDSAGILDLVEWDWLK